MSFEIECNIIENRKTCTLFSAKYTRHTTMTLLIWQLLAFIVLSRSTHFFQTALARPVYDVYHRPANPYKWHGI